MERLEVDDVLVGEAEPLPARRADVRLGREVAQRSDRARRGVDVLEVVEDQQRLGAAQLLGSERVDVALVANPERIADLRDDLTV